MSDENFSQDGTSTNDEIATNGLNSQIDDNGAKEGQQDNSDQQENNAQNEGQQDNSDKQENEFVGKPEAYATDKIELPEGMTLNESVMNEFNEFANKTNLSQKGYEQAIQYGVKLVEQTKSNMLDAFKKAEQEKVMNYQRASFNDKEIGGNNYNKALSEASPAYNKFVNSECQQLFKETGLEYHPAIIKLFRNISSEMVDDTLRTGHKTTTQQIPIEERMFPDMYKK